MSVVALRASDEDKAAAPFHMNFFDVGWQVVFVIQYHATFIALYSGVFQAVCASGDIIIYVRMPLNRMGVTCFTSQNFVATFYMASF